jgi:hypothetical protein
MLKTKIELSEEEIKMFLFLQEHYFNIQKLKEANVFSVKSKTIILHINNKGEINGVEAKVKLI